MRDGKSIRFTVEFSVGRGQLGAFRTMANDLISVVEAHEPRPRAELRRWVADNRARRVPTFVIRLTGLDTKREIVARYGADAVFDKGKPAPHAAARPSAGARARGTARANGTLRRRDDPRPG